MTVFKSKYLNARFVFGDKTFNFKDGFYRTGDESEIALLRGKQRISWFMEVTSGVRFQVSGDSGMLASLAQDQPPPTPSSLDGNNHVTEIASATPRNDGLIDSAFPEDNTPRRRIQRLAREHGFPGNVANARTEDMLAFLESKAVSVN